MKIFKSAFVVGMFTLLSRIFGFVRDILIAKFIGAGLLSDAFFAAFKLPNLFRKIFAEGALNSAFVPIFSRLAHDNKKRMAKTFAINLFSILLYSVFVLTIVTEIFMPTIIKVFIPGFIGNPEKFSLTVDLARIVFPYLIFISMVSLMSGILNSLNKFASVAATPIILNITFIFFIIFLNGYYETMAHTLAYAVFVAGILQFLWITFFSIKSGFLLYPRIPKLTKHTREFFRKFVPGVMGAGVMQLNTLVDVIMATTIASGVSFLYYADRIMQFPLALIGTALGIVLLPTLSKQLHSKPEKALKTQNNALLVALVLILPAATALFIMAENIIMTLFERGAFTAFHTGEVSKILQVYAFGLPMFVLVKIFTPSFFARKDTKTPMQIATVCLLINVTLNLIFIKPYGYVGIAMATVISSFFNLLLLVVILLKRKQFKFDQYFGNNLVKVIYGCVIMAIVIIFVNAKFVYLINLSHYELNKIAGLLTLIIVGLVSYFAVIYLTRLNVLKFIRKE